MNQDGIWLSILDYATARKLSISTIRRSIKAGHVKHREEKGKYYIWTRETKIDNKNVEAEFVKNLELEFLKKQNRELREEINDLKMLLEVYENQHLQELPALPVTL